MKEVPYRTRDCRKYNVEVGVFKKVATGKEICVMPRIENVFLTLKPGQRCFISPKSIPGENLTHDEMMTKLRNLLYVILSNVNTKWYSNHTFKVKQLGNGFTITCS